MLGNKNEEYKMRVVKTLIGLAVFVLLFVFGVYISSPYKSENNAPEKSHTPIYVERKDTNNLIILYPQYSRVDLVCGEIPSKSNSSVILVAGAAYTGACLDKFHHTNIAGNHVSSGVLHKGYKCKRNSGAFVFYNNSYKFCEYPYSHELDSAAYRRGAGFGQELLLYNGNIKKTYRKDSNKNQFRALCSHEERLCIIESDSIITLGSFKQRLKEYGVSDAIYLDMGGGWNHAWYREGENVVELHPRTHKYSTNWITFYK